MWQKLFGTRPDSRLGAEEANALQNERAAAKLLEPTRWVVRAGLVGLLILEPPFFACFVGLTGADFVGGLPSAGHGDKRDGGCPPLRRANLGAIGEMMFGIVPMSFKGTTTKLHPINGSTPQLLLTVLFSISQDELPEFDDGFEPPIAGPRPTDRLGTSPSSQGSASGGGDDEGSSRTTSLASSLSSFHNVHLDRRLKKAGLTSLENGRFRPSTLPGRGSHEDLVRAVRASVDMMYALGLLVTLGAADRHLRDFIYTHYSLLESRLHKLYWVARATILHSLGAARASQPPGPPPLSPYLLQNDPSLTHAVVQFQANLVDLYRAPRIQAPLWLDMLSFPNMRARCASSLISELAPFISTLLTSVLSYHLSWVPVVPADFYKPETTKASLSYNPLWAQLSDLYGNVGGLSRLTRTVVVGADGALVRRILFILSYFIRCNDVVLRAQKYRFEDVSQQVASQAGAREGETFAGGTRDEPGLGEVPLIAPQEVQIFPPGEASRDPVDANFLYTKSYGRSLLTGYHGEYLPGFVLQGVPRFDFIEQLEGDLLDAVTFPVDEPVREAACVVADCNTWHCYVVKYDTSRSAAAQVPASPYRQILTPPHHPQIQVTRPQPSRHITESLEEVCKLFELGIPAEACLQYLEDRLRQLHYKSLLLSSVLREQVGFGEEAADVAASNLNDLPQILSAHASDLPIIFAITATYDPVARDLMLPAMR
ncbi:hypothetical protein L0F63_001632 [Massospora cicadina]|nr:hypothetical protein L0F63_001632 [Massospora cicadina]